jgi:DNA-binding NarL/FixJ family response regulator
MPATHKVTILLADEDALRRDGLAAVLSGTDNFDVVGGVPDGEAALEEIRQTRPDVAVVDLNLPRLHGIELIRRVRAEDLKTRIVILAGTSDDEIIREVVRAGGDGYLLKNGPSRHLVDAISYVQDGGQYFSPQLRRDGRDRHLLEEPPRQYSGAARDSDDHDAEERPRSDDSSAERRSPRNRLVKVRHERRTAERPLRERFREQSGSDLSDRDYEIMSMMADGIRPILDRLDEIDNRVAQMEEGEAPVPSNPRGWLSHEIADTLGENRIARRATAGEIEASLPAMIEDAVTKHFNQMAGKLQQEIEETHVRTLESFVKNIQVKLVQRVSALEQDMSKQAEAMMQLREYSARTEDNLSRLISGVDRLASELPRRLAPERESSQAAPVQHTRDANEDGRPRETVTSPAADSSAARPMRRIRPQPARRARGPLLAVLGGIVVLGIVGWAVAHVVSSQAASQQPAPAPTTPTVSGKKLALPANADIKTRMQAAQQYADNKDYALAEQIYKQVVADDPNNADAWTALASVLFREDKVDESAAVLEKIPK